MHIAPPPAHHRTQLPLAHTVLHALHPPLLTHLNCKTHPRPRRPQAQREAELLAPRAMLAPLRSDAGHRAGDPHRPELSAEAAFLRSKVHELLASE